MEIGEEISQKIRSAIKAKLVDLGAYVDDELPDYIMVMVANRKTQPQMTEDLNLFLGNHTDAFTTWLHGLLNKLQSITAETPKENTSAENRENTEKTKKDKTTDSEAKQKSEVKEKTAPNPEKVETTDSVIHLLPEHDEFEEVTKPVGDAVSAKKRRKSDEKHRSQEHRQHSSTKNSGEKEKHSSTSRARGERVNSESKRRDRSRKDSSGARTQVDRASKNRPSDRPPLRSEGSDNRKKRSGSSGVVLASSIGAVIKHDVEISDEEYDPLNPSVGSVASVITISQRKPSLPTQLQANKSLLFKAMKDAEKSVTTGKATATVQEKTPPNKSSRKRRSSENAPRHGHRSSRSRDRSPLIRDHAASKADTVAEASHLRSNMYEDGGRRIGAEKSSLKYRLSGSKKQSVRDRLGGRVSEPDLKITRMIKEEPNEKSRKRSSDSQVKADETQKISTMAADLEATRLATKKRKTNSEPIDLTTEEDKRQVECERSESPTEPDVRRVEHSESDADEIVQEIAESEDTEFSDVDFGMSSTTESGNADVSFRYTDGATTSQYRLACSTMQIQPQGRSSPKFVVTLDGIDPASLDSHQQSFDSPVTTGDYSTSSAAFSHTVRPAETQAKNIGMVRPQRPAVQPVTINLDEMDEEDGTTVANTKALKAEKCRFFPSCKNGEQCPYVHPIAPCTNFPNCRFGERCLYIHPDCKFDAACTRPNCPFSHRTPRSPAGQASAAPPVILQPVGVPMMLPRAPGPRAPRPPRPALTTCRFFPKCTNMNCPFIHPKPCRFGLSCTNKALCRFSHPALPSGKQLRWTPNAAKPVIEIPQGETKASPAVTAPTVPAPVRAKLVNPPILAIHSGDKASGTHASHQAS